MPDNQVLILNWNNGPDTVACISSIISLNNINILLLDNASEDDSLSYINRFLIDNSIDHQIIFLSELNVLNDISTRVLVVKSETNLGFAKGNNVLLRFALKYSNSKYAWLLNNDAFADKSALAEMIKKMEEDTQVAFVGSVILDYTNKNVVQSCGVKYYKYFGVSKLLLKDLNWQNIDKSTIPISQIDFQHGASLLVRMSLLKEIGLMDEQYFLYFEEQDWQWIARSKGYKNVLALNSIIYHKGSVSTNNKKYLFFYYYNKSAILFARKHNNSFVCLCATFMLMGITLVRAKFYYKSIFWGMKGIFEAWNKK